MNQATVVLAASALFRWISVDSHQLRPVRVRASLTGHVRLLRPQVTQEPYRRQPGHEPVRVRNPLGSGLGSEDHLFVRHEQDK